MRIARPLRNLIQEEEQALQRIVKASSERVDVVKRAKAILAVRGGKPTSPAQELVGQLRPSITMAHQRSLMAWIAVILILLSACSSAPTASPSPSPSVHASSHPCPLQGQTPPSGN